MKNITLDLTNYTIKGIADITMWGGGNACIEMDDFNIRKLKHIKENINDGGFGVESINGAICNIYRNYQGTLIYSRTITIGSVSEKTHEYYYSR